MSTEPKEHDSAIALRPVTGNSLKEVEALGRIFKASGYFRDIRDEAQAVTKILYGRELGFTPIVSIMGIYIIEGKPSLSANLLATMVKRSGRYDYRVKENSNTRCALEFRARTDSGTWESLGETEFTIEDAKTAGALGKDNWRKYPKAMLFARALSAGVRVHCPDVSACPLYVPEELGASVSEEGEVTELPKPRVTAEVITEDIPVAPPPKPAETPTPAPIITGYAEAGQCVNFYRTFKAACPPEVDADTYAHDWLAKNGFYDPEHPGENIPSAKGIPKADFERVKIAAKKYAQGLK